MPFCYLLIKGYELQTVFIYVLQLAVIFSVRSFSSTFDLEHTAMPNVCKGKVSKRQMRKKKAARKRNEPDDQDLLLHARGGSGVFSVMPL